VQQPVDVIGESERAIFAVQVACLHPRLDRRSALLLATELAHALFDQREEPLRHGFVIHCKVRLEFEPVLLADQFVVTDNLLDRLEQQ